VNGRAGLITNGANVTLRGGAASNIDVAAGNVLNAGAGRST